MNCNICFVTNRQSTLLKSLIFVICAHTLCSSEGVTEVRDDTAGWVMLVG